MYRLQVKYKGRWKWGIVRYDTIDEATNRVAELGRVGIVARIRRNDEMFEG